MDTDRGGAVELVRTHDRQQAAALVGDDECRMADLRGIGRVGKLDG